jgi:hypothetical protein
MSKWESWAIIYGATQSVAASTAAVNDSDANPELDFNVFTSRRSFYMEIQRVKRSGLLASEAQYWRESSVHRQTASRSCGERRAPR